MHGLSWNVDRVSKDMCSTFVHDVMSSNSVVLIQERGHLPPGDLFGHKIFASELSDRTPAVILHRAYAGMIVASWTCVWCAAVVIKIEGQHILLMSLYLPNSWEPIQLLKDALIEVNCIMHKIWRLKIARAIVAGDANCEVPSDGAVVGSAVSGTCMSDRCALLLEFTATWNLSWASSFSNRDAFWTHESKATKVRKVLDYVWVYNSTCACEVKYDIDCNSDHRAISFVLDVPAHKNKNFSTKRKNWKSADLNQYMSQCFGHAELAALSIDPKVQDLQSAFKQVMANYPSEFLPDARRVRPVFVQNAFEALRDASSDEEKLVCAKRLYRAKRKWQDSVKHDNFVQVTKKTLHSKAQSQKQPPKGLRCKGELSESSDSWGEEITDFYAGIYKDTSIHHGQIDAEARKLLLDSQRLRLEALRSRHVDDLAKNGVVYHVPLWLMLETRASFSGKGSSAPGRDEICWSFLSSLPDEVVGLLGVAFQNRINLVDGHTGIVHDWSQVMVTLIPKIDFAECIGDWRPISLTSCIQKWYCSVAIHLLSVHSSELSDQCIGFRQGHQVPEITETIRLALEKSHSWARPFFILQSDISKAFDSLDHGCLESCLVEQGSPAALIHAVLAELSECTMTFKMGAVHTQTDVLLFSAGKQGASDTPHLWNRYLDSIGRRARLRFEDLNLGIVFDRPAEPSFRLTHMYWADDCYFFAESQANLEIMFGIMSEELGRFKLTWKPASLKFLASHDSYKTCNFSWKNALGVWDVKGVDRFVALGVAIDRRGSTECAVQHRAAHLFATWSQVRRQFCCRRLPLLLRIRRFYETLGRSFLFGGGGWRITESILRRIQTWEQSILRQIVCRHKLETETWGLYYARVDQLIKHSLNQLRIMPLSLQACVLYFAWGGHITRLPANAPVRVILNWRDLGWFRLCQHLNSDEWGRQRSLLSTAGKPKRWEDNFDTVLGFSWKNACQDRHEWAIRKFEHAAFIWKALLGKTCMAKSWTFPAHISPRMQSTTPTCMLPEISALFMIDNKQVSHMVNGIWLNGGDVTLADTIKHCRWVLHSLRFGWKIKPWPGFPHSIMYCDSKFNWQAKMAAKFAAIHGDSCWYKFETLSSGDKLYMTCSGVASGKPRVSCVACVLWLFRNGVGSEIVAILGKKLRDNDEEQVGFQALSLALHVFIEWIRGSIGFLAAGDFSGSLSLRTASQELRTALEP